MGTFVNTETGVRVSVDDSKDERFASELWEADGKSSSKSSSAAKKTASSKSDSK